LNILEVDTALAYIYSIFDPDADFFSIKTNCGVRYLQTSPEYAMKYLLSQGIGSIYQICKSFRNDRISKLHNYEFSMLEWYRLGLDHKMFMDEIKIFLKQLNSNIDISDVSYREIFIDVLNIDPYVINLTDLKSWIVHNTGEVFSIKYKMHDCLCWLFHYFIQPYLAKKFECVFIYNYPQDQAEFSRVINVDGRKVAARFEIFYRGLELANGYYEIINYDQQKSSFLNKMSLIDRKNYIFKNTFHHSFFKNFKSLPKCSGVSFGLDRLFMSLMTSN